MTVRVRNSRSWLTTTVPARSPVTKRLQPLQAVQVEVVGRLVEQEDVVAATAAARRGRRGRPGRRRAPSSAGRGRRSRPSESATSSARSSRSAPPRASQRSRLSAYASSAPGRARRPAPGWPRPSRVWAAATPVRRARKSAHGLARPALRLLRQVADGRRWAGRAAARPPRVVSSPASIRSRVDLPGAVDADQADHVAGRDDEVEPGEQRAVAVAGGEVLGDEGCGHQAADPTADGGTPRCIFRRALAGRAGRQGSRVPYGR